MGVYGNVVRPRLTSVCYRFGIWVYGAVPRAVVRWWEQVFWDVFDAVSRSKRALPIVVPLSIGDARFELSIIGERPGVQRRFERLSVSNEVYEPIMTACLTRILKKADTPAFMDVGAFMGYYAAYVSAFLGDTHPVYAVESNPRYVDAIRESVRLNRFRRLHVYQAALADRASTVGIEGQTVLFDPDRGQTVMSTTLDDLCRREGIAPTIIKIDVHGAEGKVVLGMRKILETVEYVLLEVHPLDYLQKYSPGVRRSDIIDTLEAAELTVYYISGHRHTHSDGLHQFMSTGTFTYRRLDRQIRDLLLFDRHDDFFLLASRCDDIESLLGASSRGATNA